VEGIGDAFRIALRGTVATDFIDGDHMFNVRVRLPPAEFRSPGDLETILLFPANQDRRPVYLGDVATLSLVNSPAQIKRDQQQRIMEVSARVSESSTLGEVMAEVERRLGELVLPPGYVRYDGGAVDTLRKSRSLAERLLALALFLVLVVMAIQYESLRNPLVILLSVPFAAIGVAAAINTLDLPLSMPLWLGMIMLSGIVVNNAIVLVEYIEIERNRGTPLNEAIIEAGRLRLRPILMTTLTTVAGMAPLAAAVGEGAEMLQPLAITIVWGLSFSMLVSLLMVPSMYRLMCARSQSPSAVTTVDGNRATTADGARR
jgi:multidrug efflux pump subunit AcrB